MPRDILPRCFEIESLEPAAANGDSLRAIRGIPRIMNRNICVT